MGNLKGTSAGFVLSALFVLLGTSVGPSRADLLISEMCDPRYDYTTDRFIEIYNAGSAAIDLTGWKLVAVGNQDDIFTWTLHGTIDAEEALVAGDATTAVQFPIDFPAEAWSGANGTWNGKIGDGAKLIDPGENTVDYAVVTTTAFENADYVRASHITTPSPVYVAAEWTSTPVYYPTDGSPGIHFVDTQTPRPTITDIQTDPSLPLSADSVMVVADVTDTAAVITSVVLSWGTLLSSLANDIDMESLSGDSYRTLTPIPPHPAGTTIYFEISAANDIGGETTSDPQDYVVPNVVTLHEIQGEAPTSPYEDEAVLTHGAVTASYDSYFVLQDGGGPWDGIWVQSEAQVDDADSLILLAWVDESTGNTLLLSPRIVDNLSASVLPGPIALTTAGAAAEPYEGLLVVTTQAACTNPGFAGGEWEIDDGSGPIRVDDLGHAFDPTLGTRYDLTGTVTYADGRYLLVPRNAADILWAGDDFAPVIFETTGENETTVRVTLSEAVDPATAETVANYSIPGLTILDAVRDPNHPHRVTLAVTTMSAGPYTLTIDGVEDLFGNPMVGVEDEFTFVPSDIPEGYYDSAEGLSGTALKEALHEIIDAHTAVSYPYVWTAFYTTDAKPNGKVWDIYSDVPGGTPPYEYTFGIDQGGIGGVEGTGYTREHSWPKSWFGGEVPPMYTDLFALYPTDAHVNGTRGLYPYGEVAAPSWTSLNGSELGPCTCPGYAGLVFEPIDEYKGDLARTYFYMSTRYYGEDAGWPGSPMVSGAELLPWAVDLLLMWDAQDPVSFKERERNAAIYAVQHNRNPFVDCPDFTELVFNPASSTGSPIPGARVVLDPITPNPFASSTMLRFALPSARDVQLAIYDVTGRQVAVLASGPHSAGDRVCVWDGRDSGGWAAAAGFYLARLKAGDVTLSRRLILLR